MTEKPRRTEWKIRTVFIQVRTLKTDASVIKITIRE